MGVFCAVYNCLILSLIICYIHVIFAKNNKEFRPSTEYPKTLQYMVTLRQHGQIIDEDYVIYNKSKPLNLECIDVNLPPNTNLYWYQLKPSRLLDSNVVEQLIPNTDVKHTQNATKLRRTFTKLDNNTQIYCLARRFNGSRSSNITKSKFLTLILDRINLTHDIEYFRKLQDKTTEVPLTESFESIEREPQEKDSSMFMIVGVVIGLIVIFLIIICTIYIRKRIKKSRINNQPPQEEPEYATIPDVVNVNYAKLALPRNLNRELPKIPTESSYTTIVGKLVPKTNNNVSNTSNN